MLSRTTKSWIEVFQLIAIVLMSLITVSTTQAGTIAHWRFEPGALTIDSAGSNTLSNTGVTSSLDISPDAMGSGSASFSGSQTVFSTVGTLDLTGVTDMTIEWFMKTTDTSLAAVFQNTASTSGAGVFGGFINDINEIEGYQRGTSGTYLKSTTMTVNDDTWRHFAVTITGAAADTSRIQLYVDGVNLGIDGGFSGSGTPAFVNSTFHIGSINNTASRFTGLLDELRISDEVLAPSEFLNVPLPPVPEPSTFALLSLGLFGLVRKIRRPRRTA